MNQLQLFTDISDSKFPKYHSENPQIYEAFKKYAKKAIEKGDKRLSADYIFHVIRWESPIGSDEKDFKVNNNYTSFYSRMFMNEYPEFKGIFNLRKSKFD